MGNIKVRIKSGALEGVLGEVISGPDDDHHFEIRLLEDRKAWRAGDIVNFAKYELSFEESDHVDK
jgi:hypothetical protein